MLFCYPAASSVFASLLIFFLLITITTSAAQDDADQNYQACSSRLFECGDLNLGFPFWGADRPSFCGLPEFNLNCSGPIATISISGLTYQILEIDNVSRILTLVQTDIERDLCLTDPRNTTVVENLFEFTQDTQLLTLYYGCSAPNGFSLPATLGTFDCSRGSDDYFVPAENLLNGYEAAIRSWLGGCRNQIRVPVNRTAVPSLESQPTYARLTDTIRQGFGMRWSGNDSLCATCTTSGGQCGFNETTRSFTCFCVDQPYGTECERGATGPTAQSGGNSKARGIAIGLSAGAASVAGIALCLLLIYRQRKRKAAQIMSKDSSTLPSSTAKTRTTTTRYSTTSSSYTTSMSDIEKGTGSTYFGVQVFAYDELEEATENFDDSKELGDGGFGTVYYGQLSDGRAVAVKRLYENNMRRTEQFMNEIEILAKLRHKNLVTLYGCTSRHSRELLLVYEYISNGTVADHLHGSRRQSDTNLMTWRVRMNIAVQTADALSFLHASHVFHRDVKTNNILLDENFHVKVADFGLSRLFPTHVTHVSTAPQGTPGYVDPEYYQCYQLTDKSDVYSFGVVLMELITSLQAVDTCRHRHDINLANMAVSRIQNQQLGEMVDPSLGFDTDYGVRKMVTSVAELAFRCLQQERDMRPTMSEVVGVLKRIERENDGNLKAEVVDIGKDDVGLLQNFSPPVLSPDSAGNDKWNKAMRTM